MRSREAYKHDLRLIVDVHHKPKSVSSNVEDDPISRQQTGRRVSLLDRCRSPIVDCRGFIVPRKQRLLRLRMLFPARLEGAPGDHAHATACTMFPKSGTRKRRQLLFLRRLQRRLLLDAFPPGADLSIESPPRESRRPQPSFPALRGVAPFPRSMMARRRPARVRPRLPSPAPPKRRHHSSEDFEQ